jgi:ABC-type Fe3+/spermidine/putrescine transport system ATPase subunit
MVGPSGCGKTTLIKSISGMVQPDDGEVLIDGRSMNSLPVEDRHVGYVFQEVALFPHMNVRDNVSYGLMVKGLSLEERRRLSREMLDMMDLSDRASSYPSELSGGARQKTGVARALASGSSLLLLDEPLGSLDLKVRTVLRYELRGLVKDLGLTAIHVTHDQEEALSISDRVAVMKAGRIIEVGEPTELYMNPGKLFTAKFLGEANFMEGRLLEADGEDSVVDVEGIALRVKANPDLKIQKGDIVVLAIRPEFIHMERKAAPGGANLLRGTVKAGTFVGDLWRYEVEIESSRTLLVKHYISRGETEFKSRDEVILDLPRDRLLIYKFPEEGLERELSLE